MTRAPAFAAAVAAALALAACAAPAPRDAAPPQSAAPGPAANATQPPPVTATPAPAEKTARLAPEPAPPPPPDPDRLKGLSGDEVQKLIGTPQFARADDPAALWRYRGGGCLLDLYLHAEGAAYRVTYFQFRPDPRSPGGAKAKIDASACFAALLHARKDRG